MKQKSFAAWIIGCLLFSLAAAQAAYDIHFHSGTISPQAGELRLAQDADAKHVILQFYEPLTRQDRERLTAAGVELLGYLPERAFAALLARPITGAELSALGVRAALQFAPEYKLHPRLIEQDFGTWSSYDNGRRMFNVDVFRDVDLKIAAATIAAAGFEVGDHIEATHSLVVAADPAKLMELAALDEALFINEMSPPFESLNSTVRTRLHVNEAQTAPYNLSGDGVTILVFDGGLVDATHGDFGGRVTAMEDGAVAAHPTHVAGTVGGNGNASGGTNRGMAPGATIISGEYDACVPFCFYNSPNDVSDDYAFARETYGIELTTNSMGANVSPNGYPCSWFGDYELSSRVLDGLVRETVDRPLLQFWAAGNERGDPGCGVSSYRCMSIPASAKNIITIGATTSTDALASFSSFGPTDDGRVKPEVVATGVNVTSCSPGGGYEVMSGTSMATPASAGVACLVLEKWHELYPGSPDPLPETVKALYINSATDLGATGPDFQSGYGIVNALRAVQQLEAGGTLQGELAIDETFTRTFNVAAGTSALDVSLAWSDVPALGNVIPTLVNDLRLVLVSPSNIEHNPWVLNPSSPGSAATAGVDSVNVCERVHVNNPESGTWTVRVTGEINDGDAQTFGLASSVTLVAGWTMISGQLHPEGQPGSGVAGSVMIEDEGTQALSDAQGNYVLHVPQGGTYTLLARSYGYTPLSQQVTASGPSMDVDFALDQASGAGTIGGRVEDQVGTPIEGAVISYHFPNATIPGDVSDVEGLFSRTLPSDNEYVVRASFGGLETEATVLVEAGQSTETLLVLEDTRYAPAGPDAFGYYCYESGDHEYAPTFEYQSIAPAAGGPGTQIGPGTGNDWMIEVALPFNVRFYGTVYGHLTVAADGWVGFGNVSGGTQPWTNTFIPSDDLPNRAVYVFWDDLYPYEPSEGGQIAQFHDAPNGRFIVEYYQVSQFAPLTNKVTAQLILYTQGERPTRTGDTEIEVHYERFDYDGPDTDQDATLGIEDSTGSTGLMIMFEGGSDPQCFPVAAQRALRYSTGPIIGNGTVTGQIVAIPPTNLSGATLRIGSLSFPPNADGSFSIAGVPAGNFRLEFEFEGYENLTSEQFTVPPDGSVNVDLTSYRLDPPQELTGEFNAGAMQISLNWRPPDWGMDVRHGGNALDELANYKVYVQGRGVVGQPSDTFFVYQLSAQGVYRIWVTAAYDGGESDSSNIIQFIVSDADDAQTGVPTELYLAQNYPNPFNPTTSIAFGLPSESAVTLQVFDVQGRLVRTILEAKMPAGHHRMNFDGAKLGSGVYFYRLDASGRQLIGKMMLLR